MSTIDFLHAVIAGMGITFALMALVYTIAIGGFGDD
jgi:hypothetical protein